MLGAAIPALAVIKTVTLDVPYMTCTVCTITVEKALLALHGVSKVDVVYAKRETIATYSYTRTHCPNPRSARRPARH